MEYLSPDILAATDDWEICCFQTYGVNDRIQKTVHVAEPDEERESQRIDLADAVSEEIVSDTDGVHYVDGEERYPAEEKHTWTGTNIHERVPQVHTHTHTHTHTRTHINIYIHTYMLEHTCTITHGANTLYASAGG